MKRLSEVMKECQRSRRAGFIPYITAGDPDLEATERLVKRLEKAGAVALELGVPFSDPMADGPVNQRSAERALKSGTTLLKILASVKRLREGGVKMPLVLFTYLNPVLKMGYEKFAEAAVVSGVSGVLTLDLPPEEAEGYCKILGAVGLETIFLASPTTSSERLKMIGEKSTGFVYYVSRTGVTGTQNSLSESLRPEMKKLREAISGPIAVGFGISAPEHARDVSRLADGVIVGSALVKRIEDSGASLTPESEDKIIRFAESLITSIEMKGEW
jgi:tryptophan synthase alpha chain